jgi:N-acetylglutamate synthase
MSGSALLDQLMANAWPALVSEVRHGWRFRWTNGLTRRANSVLAVGGDEHVPELLSAADRFFEARGGVPTLQVSTASAPRRLASYLETSGYRPTARTLVEQATTGDVVERTPRASFDVDVSEHLTDEWFETYWSVGSTRGWSRDDTAIVRDVLLAPSLPTVFVAARRGAEVIGVGQLVLERGRAGVQCMATRPTHRRQGVGVAVLHALANEAATRGAEHMYLAVMADNTAALDLYERSGFDRVHEYSYFARPPSSRCSSGRVLGERLVADLRLPPCGSSTSPPAARRTRHEPRSRCTSQ